MLVDSLLRGGMVMLVPLLYAMGQLALWYIYVVAAIYGRLMMTPLAGGPVLVSDLVSKRHLAIANALETLSFTLSGVIGPPVAGGFDCQNQRLIRRHQSRVVRQTL